MMSGRIYKDSSSVRRHRVASKIEDLGVLSLMAPCSRCERLGLLCFVHGSHAKCSECTKANVSCDGTFSEAEWEQIQDEKRKLKEELRKVRFVKAEAIRRMAEEVKRGTEMIMESEAKTSSLEGALDGLSRREDLMVSREVTNLEAMDPPSMGDDPFAFVGDDIVPTTSGQ